MSGPQPSRLCVIIDVPTCAALGKSPSQLAWRAASGGARLIQLRAPGVPSHLLWEIAREVATATSVHRATLLVNDRADVALALGVHGVHRPSHGLPVSALRALVGRDGLISAAAHSLDDALALRAEGVDLLLVSPVFETASKPGYGPALGLDTLGQWCASLEGARVYALGGVTPERCAQVLEAGAYGVAMMGEVVRAQDPALVVMQALDALGELS